MTYNNNFERKQLSSYRRIRRRNVRTTIAQVVFILISSLIALFTSEKATTLVKVVISLSCLAALFSVVHFFEVNVLGLVPAIVIGLVLLAVVSFCFSDEE